MAETKNKIERLKSKRQVIIGQLSRVSEFAKTRASAALVVDLETRLKALEDIKISFDNVQSKIEELDDTEWTLKTRAEFEENYFDIRPILITSINDVKRQPDLQTSTNAVLDTTIGGTPIRLPEIPVPRFSGEYIHWTSFYQTFSSLIHNNPALNNITRFHFLRSALSEKALSCIRALEITEANYDVALQTLITRYNKLQVIAHEHLKNLFNLPCVSRNSALELRQLLDELNVHLNALTSLGRPTAYWDDPIIYLVCSKLDALSLDKWNDVRSKDRFPTLNELKTFLENRAYNIDEKSSLALAAPPPSMTRIFKPKPVSTARQNTLTAIHEKSCTYCSGTRHNIYRCKQFLQLSPKQRFNSANALKICLNCLKAGHITATCSIDKCRTCNQLHHTLLHEYFIAQLAQTEPNSRQD